MNGPYALAAPMPGASRVHSAAAVAKAYQELAAGIQPRVDEGRCVLLGVLIGGLVPLVEIARRLGGDLVLDVCRVSRYGDALRGGEPRWLMLPGQELEGRDVVLVDDIYDQGVTLSFVAEHCHGRGARSVRIAALVRKRHGRALAGPLPDLVGLEVGDEYVFGCGMDYRGRWRHLPDIWAVADEDGLPNAPTGAKS
jgi:hypoxanthine phosphoribosyltransferase